MQMSQIRILREKIGLTQSQLAEMVGTSQPQIRRLEVGERKLTKEWAERLAHPLQTTAEQLLFGDASSEANSIPPFERVLPNAHSPRKLEGIGKLIPVYGQAVAGDDGEFIMNGNILYEIMAPPVISAIKGAYAIVISGNSMEPRYYDGEKAFIDPTRRVRPGDFVVAQIQMDEHGPPHAFVKRLVKHTTTTLVLEQFNPAKELTFPHERVVSVHFIAMAGMA